jgi:hypothetical protein
MKSRIGWTLISALMLAGSLAKAQTSDPAPPHDAATSDPGGAIAVPIDPDAFDAKRYEIPELAGSSLAIGSQLIDGELPRPLADYVVRNGVIVQRLSLYRSGLAVVHLTGAGGTIRKRVIIPQDALEVYRKFLSIDQLRSIRPEWTAMSSDTARIRIYDDQGKYVERIFPLKTAVNTDLETMRTTLHDLLRVIAEDRLVTNPMTAYTPVVGDRLLADDKKTFEVIRVASDGSFVELKCLQDPTRLFIAIKDLHNYFISSLGPKPKRAE